MPESKLKGIQKSYFKFFSSKNNILIDKTHFENGNKFIIDFRVFMILKIFLQLIYEKWRIRNIYVFNMLFIISLHKNDMNIVIKL